MVTRAQTCHYERTPIITHLDNGALGGLLLPIGLAAPPVVAAIAPSVGAAAPHRRPPKFPTPAPPPLDHSRKGTTVGAFSPVTSPV